MLEYRESENFDVSFIRGKTTNLRRKVFFNSKINWILYLSYLPAFIIHPIRR